MASNSIPYKKIVAGLSLHQQGHPAVVRAASVARALGAEVNLVHVITKKPDDNTDELAMVREQFDLLKAGHPEIVGVEQIVASKVSAIHSTSRTVDADLLVIGSHVHGRLRTLAGVTADKVLHSADRDVLSVKTDLYADAPPAPYAQILVSIDLKEDSLAICTRAADLANALGASLNVAHVMEHFPVDRENMEITPENRDPTEYQKEIKLQQVEKIVRQTCLKDAPIEILVGDGSAAGEIVAHAEKTSADLIITGSGTSRLLGQLFESKTDGIVHHAPCDVLVVKGSCQVR